MSAGLLSIDSLALVDSFHFNWPRFSDQFHADATQMLNAALNKGNKPRIIADKIEVVELSMGTLVRRHRRPFLFPILTTW